jgi:hypothetical protein
MADTELVSWLEGKDKTGKSVRYNELYQRFPLEMVT